MSLRRGLGGGWLESFFGWGWLEGVGRGWSELVRLGRRGVEERAEVSDFVGLDGKSRLSDPAGRDRTLQHSLCTRYPAFKTRLGKVFSHNRELLSVQSYALLFESLLRDPLTDLQFIGPELVIIDALDENEDASSRRRDMFAFHRFLAKRLPELPANFRILVTSRPEVDILDAFTESPLVRRLHMDEPQLSDGVDDDIRTYVRAKLSKAKVAEADMEMLVKKAEGLFQWASVACD